MLSFKVFKQFMNKTFLPPKTILGRWNLDSNFIKTDLANHDCCGDKLCGDPRLTTLYIEKNLHKKIK